MDWLPSGLILKDPVWIIFFGSTWEMAHSISSTRALQAVRSRVRTIRTAVCICANQRAKRWHTYRHTSCPVLVWPPGWSSGGETEPKTTAERLPSSCTYGSRHTFDHIIRLTHQTFSLISEQQLDLRLENDVQTRRAQFGNFSLNLRVPGRDCRSHLLRCSTLFHHIRWNVVT